MYKYGIYLPTAPRPVRDMCNTLLTVEHVIIDGQKYAAERRKVVSLPNGSTVESLRDNSIAVNHVCYISSNWLVCMQ